MRVCHIVPSLEERHGGPSKSVRALAAAQRAAGLEVTLLATHEEPAAQPAESGALVFRRDFPRRLCHSAGLRDHLHSQGYDVVHHHSVWLRTLAFAHDGARRHGAKLVISPRGMLSDWAVAHRPWRKKFAEWFVHPGAFANASGWHATSDGEAGEIRSRGWTQPVCVAPNGVALPSTQDIQAAREHWRQACPALRGRPVALFYSRFHRKKRLRELFDLWLAVPRGDWLLLLAGLPQEYSLPEVQGWIDAAGARNRVIAADSTGHPPPYAAAQLFLLPSHSENFGLVVAEALAAGVPALVTDSTPWAGLAARRAGWCVPWLEYPAALGAALGTPADQLAVLGAVGRAWMEAEYSWARAARLTAEFYRSFHGR